MRLKPGLAHMRPWLARRLPWLAAVALLFVALDPRSPYLLVVRGGITAALVVSGILGLAVVERQRQRGNIGRVEGGLLAAAFLAVCVLAASDEADFRRQRAEVLAAPPQVRELGQHFMVGYTRFAEVAVLAERGLIGGIYLGRGNVRGRTLDEVRAEIDALQALRQQARLPPLIVAADQEGGSVAHMTPPLTARPALATLVAAGNEIGEGGTLEERARAYGDMQGRELAALGVTLNFGPVVDLRPDGGGPAFDTHTLISRRAIDADPQVVARVARAYAEGLAAQGVQATLKHFPGLGGVDVDTHHFAARLDAQPEQLATRDWLPFRAAAPASGAMMLGHVVVAALDPDQPASASRAVVQGLLRDQWRYGGLLITDDLNMGAVYRRGLCKTAVAALRAGVDMLLIAYDPEQYYRAMSCAAAALGGTEIDSAQQAASVRRIAAVAAGGARNLIFSGSDDLAGEISRVQAIPTGGVARKSLASFPARMD